MSTSSDPSSGNIPGFDVQAVEAWIGDNVASLEPPFEWFRLEGGHSNLTYRLTDGNGAAAVVRRPPEGELLPKAHDMWREFRIIKALQDTDVPVPAALGYEEDPSVTGAHFYVMGHVPGKALTSIETAQEWLNPEAMPKVALSYMDTMAALHSVDPVAVGLGELGRHDGYVARQIRTWYGSWNASIDGAGYDNPQLHELHDALQERLPADPPVRIVHGDLGLHNAMIDKDGQVTAVLDWEIGTLGDPVADFAYAVAGWGRPDDEPQVLKDAASLIPEFGSRERLIERYGDKTGTDLSNLDYYLAFNRFKTACIIHGVYARYKNGQKSTEGIDMPALYARMVGSLEHGVRLFEGLS